MLYQRLMAEITTQESIVLSITAKIDLMESLHVRWVFGVALRFGSHRD
jgi:hypothetical protein